MEDCRIAGPIVMQLGKSSVSNVVYAKAFCPISLTELKSVSVIVPQLLKTLLFIICSLGTSILPIAVHPQKAPDSNETMLFKSGSEREVQR